MYTSYDAAKTVKKSYQYDEAGRLKTSIQDGKTTAYTYDRVGNRLTMTEGSDKYVYSYNYLNQLLTKTKNGQADSAYEYNQRGNQTKEITKKKIDDVLKDVTSSYKYDLANQLEKVEQIISGQAPVVEQNFYNGDGQRIRRDVNGLVTKYFYDGENLLYTTDINNNKATENVLGPSGTIVASKRFDGAYNNMYFFYHHDIRGSVTSILDPDAKRVKGYGYNEFGETEESGSKTFLNDVKFTGAVHDAVTGLYYMNARHYNPSTGRFISQDSYKGTEEDPWSHHLYSYTTNNPINFIDPTGHKQAYIDGGWGGGGGVPIRPVTSTPKQVAPTPKANTPAKGNSGSTSGNKSGEPSGKGTEKFVPNPNGKKGGVAHQTTIDNIKETSSNSRMELEFRYITPNGTKSFRYADKVEIVDGEVAKIYQVGKVNKNGLPVTREARAIEDIMNSPNYNGEPVYFIPYNTNIGPIIYLP